MTSSILAASPWYWWIAVALLVVDVIILFALGISYCRMVVDPTDPPRLADVVVSARPRDLGPSERGDDGLR